MLSPSLQGHAQQVRVAAIVNVTVLMVLASTWLGMCIAACIQTWQLLRHIRKASPKTQPAVSREASVIK
jgi:hypothetical protein